MESLRTSSLMRLTAIAGETAFLLSLVVVSALAQKDKQRAQDQQEFLNQHLLNESFESKILIGNCESDRARYPWIDKFTVDTEIHSDLRISYYTRPNIETTGGAGTRCQEGAYQQGVVEAMPPGTVVTVRRIEMKGNRFELALEGPKSGVGGPGIGNTYGRLKFFYGGAYLSDSAPLVLLVYVSKVLRLKDFERIERAREQYRNLQKYDGHSEHLRMFLCIVSYTFFMPCFFFNTGFFIFIFFDFVRIHIYLFFIIINYSRKRFLSFFLEIEFKLVSLNFIDITFNALGLVISPLV